MSRPFLADPQIIGRGRGRAAINLCISCDQACIDRSLVGGHVSCLVNPRAGHEVDFPAPPRPSSQLVPDSGTKCERTRRAGRFVVVGGGPAGLEAASGGPRVGLARRLDARRGRDPHRAGSPRLGPSLEVRPTGALHRRRPHPRRPGSPSGRSWVCPGSGRRGRRRSGRVPRLHGHRREDELIVVVAAHRPTVGPLSSALLCGR
jgi:hypothetical protein